ncbi:MAG: ATP12 family chaperone protein, partial [Hyphomicrobiaceae bacterium]
GVRRAALGVDRPVLKRFYKLATVEARGGGDHGILLDGRQMRTPEKRPFAVPSAQLAAAIAAEWNAQGQDIGDPIALATMPLTRITNSIIDGVAARREETARDIMAFSRSDLICYRAASPQALVSLQAAAWDPICAWALHHFGTAPAVTIGIMPITQPEALSEAITLDLASRNAFEIGALHVLVTLSGSALLALAIAAHQLSPADAWHRALVDEDWQISQWGEDAEAMARRTVRRAEFMAAAMVLDTAHVQGPA